MHIYLNICKLFLWHTETCLLSEWSQTGGKFILNLVYCLQIHFFLLCSTALLTQWVMTEVQKLCIFTKTIEQKLARLPSIQWTVIVENYSTIKSHCTCPGNHVISTTFVHRPMRIGKKIHCQKEKWQSRRQKTQSIENHRGTVRRGKPGKCLGPS